MGVYIINLRVTACTQDVGCGLALTVFFVLFKQESFIDGLESNFVVDFTNNVKRGLHRTNQSVFFLTVLLNCQTKLESHT